MYDVRIKQMNESIFFFSSLEIIMRTIRIRRTIDGEETTYNLFSSSRFCATTHFPHIRQFHTNLTYARKVCSELHKNILYNLCEHSDHFLSIEIK